MLHRCPVELGPDASRMEGFVNGCRYCKVLEGRPDGLEHQHVVRRPLKLRLVGYHVGESNELIWP